jgi:hypothetical protein
LEYIEYVEADNEELESLAVWRSATEADRKGTGIGSVDGEEEGSGRDFLGLLISVRFAKNFLYAYRSHRITQHFIRSQTSHSRPLQICLRKRRVRADAHCPVSTTRARGVALGKET